MVVQDLLLIRDVEDFTPDPDLERPGDAGSLSVLKRQERRFESEVDLVNTREARGAARRQEIDVVRARGVPERTGDRARRIRK